jgi:hypothetical protein
MLMNATVPWRRQPYGSPVCILKIAMSGIGQPSMLGCRTTICTNALLPMSRTRGISQMAWPTSCDGGFRQARAFRRIARIAMTARKSRFERRGLSAALASGPKVRTRVTQTGITDGTYGGWADRGGKNE